MIFERPSQLPVGLGSWLSSLVGCGSIGGCQSHNLNTAMIDGQVSGQVLQALASANKQVKDPAAIATAVHKVMTSKAGQYEGVSSNPAIALAIVNQVVAELQTSGQIVDPVTQTPTTTGTGTVQPNTVVLPTGNVLLYGGLGLAAVLMIMSMRR